MVGVCDYGWWDRNSILFDFIIKFVMCMDIFKNGMEWFKCFYIVFIYVLLKVFKWVNF